MAVAFFNGDFFGGNFFSVSVFGRGRGDNDAPKRSTYKPTGLPPYREKKEARKTIEERVEETRQIHEEVVRETLHLPKPVNRMSLNEIESEIGVLLRKKLRTEDEEIVLMLLLAAVAG